jgi:coniferyl-aldehyde dehydrogenase
MNIETPINSSQGESIPSELTRILQIQRQAFAKEMSPSRQVRVDRLNRLEKMVIAREAQFSQAIDRDFGGRSAIMTSITEVMVVRAAIRHARRHLGGWMAPRRVAVGRAFLPGRAKILVQPLGVVGIMAPWNYPLQLLLNPLVGALAAGNRAILKPSEFTPEFAEVLNAAIAEFFAEDEVAVITGGPDVAQMFSALPFDHLIFTGSTSIGRLVAQAAAKNLTPVTLELGGKSPAIIDTTAELKAATDKLAWGKLLNAGQTCIAPDYALVPRDLVEKFVEALRASVARQYPTIAGNADYASIVNAKQLSRLNALLDDAKTMGAQVLPLSSDGDANARVMAPVAVVGVNADMLVMKEEIFGPILPIVPYDNLDDAIAYVNDHDRPLALYWFGTDNAARDKVLAQTISGGVTINDTLMHIGQDNLPFGGVGASGIGHYHGEYGFRSLSKEKPVFYQSRFSSGSLLYPPYGWLTRQLLKVLNRFA